MIKFKRFYIPPGWKCENDAWQYSYDSQGNLIQESDPKRNLQYIYDTQNRQTHILSGKTVIQENRYDGEGLRAGLNVQGKESTFLFTNGNLALELDEFNQPVKRYIRGYGAAALEHHGIYHGIHRDEQLSTGWITGVSGEIENACEYDAFGNLLGNHEEVSNCILYGGQQYDAETEQYYLRARYYNPVIGRFIQEDPYRGDGLNLYAYCGNNPVVYYDSSGNEHKHNADIEKNAERENTYKDIKKLKEDFFEIYTPDGERVIDFSYLPGKDGFKIPRRLTIGEMTYLTKEYGVEFAQVYHLGPGKNGGGGVYILYSGDISSVNIAPSISPDTILINHTHPGGTPWLSSADMRLLGFLKDIGSPQNISQIIPIGKEYTIFYDINGKRK